MTRSISAAGCAAAPSRSTPPRSPGRSRSTRIAVALNSAVPDFGSVALIVSRFVSTSSGKCSVMNASPGRSDGSMRTGAMTLPRADDTRTRSPVCDAELLGVLRRQLELLAAPQRRRVAAGLHAGVERVQPAAGGQAQRELVRELLGRRRVLDRVERRPAGPRAAPSTAARAGTSARACPRRSTATGCRRAPRAARSSCRRGSAPASAARSRRPRLRAVLPAVTRGARRGRP